MPVPGAHLDAEEFAARLRAALAYGRKDIRARVADAIQVSTSSINHWSRNSTELPIAKRASIVAAIEHYGGLGRAFFDADLDQLARIPLTPPEAMDARPLFPDELEGDAPGSQAG